MARGNRASGAALKKVFAKNLNALDINYNG